MKIIIDDKIPYIAGALEPVAEVIYLPGNKTTQQVVRDADALITRTRTICNEKLLAGSNVTFIATATIGYDHIDTEWCEKNNVSWINAPGCNAKSVEQYIGAALFTWAKQNHIVLKGKTIGIVGVGNVGKNVATFCEIIGMRVLRNDPPRERIEEIGNFVSLETIQHEADIITFHVPLNLNGDDATYHLVNREFLNNLKQKPLLVNSCRGEVFDTAATLEAHDSGLISGIILDCWENEPEINLTLLNACFISTPHIAGYSRDGKANGTMMSVQAVSRFFKLGIDDWKPTNIELPEKTVIEIDGSNLECEEVIAKAVLHTYNIEADSISLREAPEKFEKLRGDYPVRREFTSYTIIGSNIMEGTVDKLKKIGFKLELER